MALVDLAAIFEQLWICHAIDALTWMNDPGSLALLGPRLYFKELCEDFGAWPGKFRSNIKCGVQRRIFRQCLYSSNDRLYRHPANAIE